MGRVCRGRVGLHRVSRRRRRRSHGGIRSLRHRADGGADGNRDSGNDSAVGWALSVLRGTAGDGLDAGGVDSACRPLGLPGRNSWAQGDGCAAEDRPGAPFIGVGSGPIDEGDKSNGGALHVEYFMNYLPREVEVRGLE